MAPRSHSTPTPKTWPIEQLPGLSIEHQTGLKQQGIETTQQLLLNSKTQAQRDAIAINLRTSPARVTKWIALAELARIPSVGCMYCGVLLHAGIASPTQLVQTPLPRLHRQILKLHVAVMHSNDHCPSLNDVACWQHQAKQLAPRA